MKDQEIHKMFQHVPPRDQVDVNARRDVREGAMRFGSFLAETLVDCREKDDAIRLLRHAVAAALMALERMGPVIRNEK